MEDAFFRIVLNLFICMMLLARSWVSWYYWHLTHLRISDMINCGVMLFLALSYGIYAFENVVNALPPLGIMMDVIMITLVGVSFFRDSLFLIKNKDRLRKRKKPAASASKPDKKRKGNEGHI